MRSSPPRPPQAWCEPPRRPGVAGVALAEGAMEMALLAERLDHHARRREERRNVHHWMRHDEDMSDEHHEPAAVDRVADPAVGSVLGEVGPILGVDADPPGPPHEEHGAGAQDSTAADEDEAEGAERRIAERYPPERDPEPRGRPEEKAQGRQPLEPELEGTLTDPSEDHGAPAERPPLGADLEREDEREAEQENREEDARHGHVGIRSRRDRHGEKCVSPATRALTPRRAARSPRAGRARAGAPCSKGSQGGKIGEQEDTDARTDCRRDRPRIVAATGAGSVPGPQRRRLPALACTAPRGDRERLDHRREERPRAPAAAQSPGRRPSPAATGDLDRVAQAADEVPGARRHARRRRKGDAGRGSAAGEPLGDRQALYRAGAREPRALGARPSNRRRAGERERQAQRRPRKRSQATPHEGGASTPLAAPGSFAAAGALLGQAPVRYPGGATAWPLSLTRARQTIIEGPRRSRREVSCRGPSHQKPSAPPRPRMAAR